MQFNTGMRFSTPDRINAIALTPQSPQNPEAPANLEKRDRIFSIPQHQQNAIALLLLVFHQPNQVSQPAVETETLRVCS